MTDLQSKTIKQVLEDLLFNHMTRPGGECVDLALSDISKIIDDAKPDLTGTYSSVAYHDAFTKGVDQYLHNLKERLG